MSKTILVHIKQEHIDKGKPLSAFACPVALGLIASGLNNVSVGAFSAGFKFNNSTYSIINLGKHIGNFIHNFDRNNVVKPFKFKLKLVD